MSINSMIEYKPFIKWVGGKRGLLSQIIPLLPSDFKDYHEPFLGGGAVFFSLYDQGKLKGKKVYLSDINEELINTYLVVKNDPHKLIKNLVNLEKYHCQEHYLHVRAWDMTPKFKEYSDIERASRFIYLNKTCFNGLYRVNSNGYFNTPMGAYKKPNIVDRDTILKASEALTHVTIKCQSYIDAMGGTSKDDLMYIDPPYHPLTETSNFTGYDSNVFLRNEQIELLSNINELSIMGVNIVESNSDTEFIRDLYKGYGIHIIKANRFINSKGNGRGKITEILIRNIVNPY